MRISRLFVRNLMVALGFVAFAFALMGNTSTITNDFFLSALSLLGIALLLHIWLLRRPWR